MLEQYNKCIAAGVDYFERDLSLMWVSYEKSLETYLMILVRSLSDKYPWERFRPPYSTTHGLDSTTTLLKKKRMDLA